MLATLLCSHKIMLHGSINFRPEDLSDPKLLRFKDKVQKASANKCSYRRRLIYISEVFQKVEIVLL